MRTIVNALAGAVVVLAAVFAAPAADAASGVSGLPIQQWSLVRPSICFQHLFNGLTYLFIYPQSGGYIWSTEQDVVAATSGFCAYGDAFYVYTVDGVTWNYTYYVPGL